MNKKESRTSTTTLPETGFIRLWQIIGCTKRGIPAIITVCRSTWLNGITAGKYPAPIKLGARMNAWRVSDIRDLLDSMA